MGVTINKEKLKKIMEEKGWNEKRLAKEMGVSYVTVYRVMRGQRGIGKEFIAKLMKACGEDFEQLFILNDHYQKGTTKH